MQHPGFPMHPSLAFVTSCISHAPLLCLQRLQKQNNTAFHTTHVHSSGNLLDVDMITAWFDALSLNVLCIQTPALYELLIIISNNHMQNLTLLQASKTVKSVFSNLYSFNIVVGYASCIWLTDAIQHKQSF